MKCSMWNVQMQKLDSKLSLNQRWASILNQRYNVHTKTGLINAIANCKCSSWLVSVALVSLKLFFEKVVMPILVLTPI